MPLKPGTMLGPYEILSQIGAGGMGAVYKSRDTRLERIVALKVLLPHLVTHELTWITKTGSQIASPASFAAPRKTRERVAWIAAVIFLVTTAVALGLSYLRQQIVPAQPARFFVHPPEGASFSTSPNFVIVSPDGTRLAFVTTDPSAGFRIWVRSLDSLEAQALPGTEGANQPFWSADSRSIAFSAEGKLKRVDVAGGPAQTLLNESVQAGSWNKDGVILIGGGPIRRIPSSGGDPVPVTTLDSSRQETAHSWPHFLPDGNHFLYLAFSSDPPMMLSISDRSTPRKEGRLGREDSTFSILRATCFLSAMEL